MAAEAVKPSYSFVVTNCGEARRLLGPEGMDSELVCGGMSNIGSIAWEVLSAQDYAAYAELDRENRRWKAVDRYVQRCVQHEFYTDAYDVLTLAEFDFYCEIAELQELNNSRFRIWGQMFADNFEPDQRKAWLCTEFIWWVDDSEYWEHLSAKARICGCEIEVLEEGPHSDLDWPEDVVEAGGPFTEENAVKGKNHGRLERQVEFRCNVYGHSEQDVRERVRDLAGRTEHVWKQSGVAVY
jgi:hypothetical protein